MHARPAGTQQSPRSLDPTGAGRARWVTRWKPALNAFAITFGDRLPAAETY
jgi:putative transposase